MKVLTELIKFFEEIYAKNSQFSDAPNHRNYRICEKYADRCELIVQIINITYGMSAIILSLYSIVMYIVKGEQILTIPMTFPFLGAHTTDGFVTLLLFQTFVIVYSVCVFLSFDSLLVVIVLNMQMTSEIMVEQIDELERALVQPVGYIKLEIKRRLLHIISMHRKYNE